MADRWIEQFGYVGIILLLVLGGLGLPVPEEAPIIGAAILSKNARMSAPIALAACLIGVLVGDFVVYFLGYFSGEKVLSFRLTRKFITKQREAQIKGYFHRHGIKILILGRFAVGFRTAAYLTAGILRLPALKLFLTDLCAASLSTLLMFGLGYWFADWIEKGLSELKHYLVLIAAAAVGIALLYRYVKARRRAGKVIGPPVLADPSEMPLPPDDLHAEHPTPIPHPAPVLVEKAISEQEPLLEKNARETNGRVSSSESRGFESDEPIPIVSASPGENLGNSG
ncbi:MAG: hypothetical protein NVSMB14_01200 [Isosphaeraceae bacterium]